MASKVLLVFLVQVALRVPLERMETRWSKDVKQWNATVVMLDFNINLREVVLFESKAHCERYNSWRHKFDHRPPFGKIVFQGPQFDKNFAFIKERVLNP